MNMINKNFLLYVVILFVSIVPMVEAYQEMQEPDIVYINYTSETGPATLGVYSSAASALMKNMGKNCFYEQDSSTRNPIEKRYSLSTAVKECADSRNLFSVVIKLYEDVLNEPQSKSIGDIGTKEGYRQVMTKEGDLELKYLSVKVNKTKKIITELSVS